MAYQNPTIDDFKVYFERNFPFSPDPALGVTDTDILRAYQLTNSYANERLFKSQSSWSIGYMYLSAHYLTMNLQTSAKGLYATAAPGLIQSKNAGSVSTAYAIPEDYLKNPAYAQLNKTPFGQQYFQMIYPFLIGTMTTAIGHTHR